MMKPPAIRRLRVLAFDPSLTTKIETVAINQISISIPWEELGLGPVGEYIEVVDYDPASQAFYAPVNLNHPYLLAQDGLAPSETDPRFHQQMVYAVAMVTIRNFERALGRVAFWSDRRIRKEGEGFVHQFVRRLRIYPHALRGRNAYYSPDKKAVLFGYFPVELRDKDNSPGTVIFTCLSHDIIAHEVTHALLDGVHPRFNEPSNPDVHAFHEAFADIVAIFQHFTYPTVLENQIARTRGNLETENLLSQLAQEFGKATGRGGALRDALGKVNETTNQWEPRKPDPRALEKTLEPHDRGAILVAAVFRAFLLIYRAQTIELYRIATQGTGKLPDGDIHPDLTKLLAKEAAKSADRVLQMCIRAIDYCPPVNITFGDFLRGVITADTDFAPDDKNNYRVVFIQSFKEWGIYPRKVSGLGQESLLWPTGEELLKNMQESGEIRYDAQTLKKNLKTSFISNFKWNLESDRYEAWKLLNHLKIDLREWLEDKKNGYRAEHAKLLGLVLEPLGKKATIYSKDTDGSPTFEIHSARPTLRQNLFGGTSTDLVIEITQRRRGYFDLDEQRGKDNGTLPIEKNEVGDFTYRAGCTLIIDQATQKIRWIIRTPGTIEDDFELEQVRSFLVKEHEQSGNAFDAGMAESFGHYRLRSHREPFAILHEQLSE
jgi:hypothetical protein